MKSCGDFTAAGGLLFADVTARRVTCRQSPPRRAHGTGQVRAGAPRRASCAASPAFVAQAGPELRFVRCSKPGEGDELFKTIRFEFGS